MVERSSTLAENVAAALRHAIFQGAYASGERLVELSIAQEMNVSQNTVRDALRLLEQDGLVIKRARYGTHVRRYSPEEAAEIYALWAAVEGLALERGLDKITTAESAVLRALLNDLRACITHNQTRQALDLRIQFHERLAQSVAKSLTLEILQRLHNQVRLLEAIHPHQTIEDLRLQLDAYMTLMNAIATRDRARAQEFLGRCIGPGVTPSSTAR